MELKLILEELRASEQARSELAMERAGTSYRRAKPSWYEGIAPVGGNAPPPPRAQPLGHGLASASFGKPKNTQTVMVLRHCAGVQIADTGHAKKLRLQVPDTGCRSINRHSFATPLGSTAARTDRARALLCVSCV